MTAGTAVGAGGGSALAVPAFRRLWVAGVVSDAGDWLLFIALPLVVLRLTGSAFGTSLAFLLELAPAVLLAPLAGRLADRLPRRDLMVGALACQAASLLPLLAVHDRGDLPVVYAVVVAQATFATVVEPARNAVLPTLVEPGRVLSANAVVGVGSNLGRVVGGPVGGVLLAVAGLAGVALVDTFTYLVAVGLVLTLPRDRVDRGSRPTGSAGSTAGSRALRHGVATVLRDPATRAPVAVSVAASVAQGMFVVLFVFFVTDVLHGSAADVGLLRGVQAIGAIGAGVVLGVLGARVDVARLTLIGVTGFAAVSLAAWNLSFATSAMPVYVVLFGVVGAPGVLMGAGLTSLLQQATDDRRRGTAFAALGQAEAAGQAVGLLLGGALQAVVGTLPLLEVQAACHVAAAVLALVLLPAAARAAAA